MTSTPILLDKNKILSLVDNNETDIVILDRTPSTNDYLHHHASAHAIQACFAEQQTQGKGRLDRQWHSPHGVNIYCSFLFTFHKKPHALSGLSLVTALAVQKALQSYVPDDIKIKWPNDLIYAHQKLAGILIETHSESNEQTQLIIGVGINVNMTNDDEQIITQPWTSLKKITNKNTDRNPLCAELINQLTHYLSEFEKHGLTAFQNAWEKSDYLIHRKITLKHIHQTYTGIVLGIDENGCLRLKKENGEVAVFASGDSHLIK